MSAPRIQLTLTLLLALLALLPVGAAEVHSNGQGGGDWSDTLTWHGGRVPRPEDSVVIAMRDTVAIDMDHRQQVSCGALYLDPEAVLTVKPGREPRALTVAGDIECYGIIRLEATSAREPVRLQVTGDATVKERRLVLMRYAALFAYGPERSEPNARLAFLGGVSLVAEHPAPLLQVSAGNDCMVDIQRTTLSETVFILANIDNTNSSPGERLNLIDNHVTGNSRLLLTRCDTPTIRGNLFELGEAASREAPLRLDSCSLAEIRHNTLRGKWLAAIWVSGDLDSSASDNQISGAQVGLQWSGANAMIKDNVVSDCDLGYNLIAATGTMESCQALRCPTGIALQGSQMQLTQCQVLETPAKGAPLSLNGAGASMLNCNIGDDQILRKGGPPKGATVWVENLVYLVVRVKGKVPLGAQVLLETSAVSGGVPAGKADLNVRNAPAPLNQTGWTPLPASRRALILSSWRIGLDGKRQHAPFYDLKVLAPADPGVKPKVLHQQRIEPSDSWNWGALEQKGVDPMGGTATETLHLLTWAAPDSAVATVEITLP